MSDQDQVKTSTFNIDSPRLRAQIISASIGPLAIVWFTITLAFVFLGFVYRGYVFPVKAAEFNLVVFTIAPAYFALVFGFSGWRRVKEAFTRVRRIPGASLYRCAFTATEVEYESDAGVKVTVPMAVVHKFTPEEGGIMIMVDPGRVIWVPREAFATSDDFERASQWCLRAQLDKIPNSDRSQN